MTKSMGLNEIKNVVIIKESEKSKKPNAVFMGIGKTKTIGLFDTLIHNFPKPEIESVIWHELGHYVGKDNISHVIIDTIKMMFILFVVDNVFRAYSIPLTVMSFPLIMLSFLLLELLTMPITNTYTRYLEKHADLFSLRLTKNISAHVSTEMRLADMHLSEERVHPLIEFFFYTHPMTAKRIAYAREYWKKGKKKMN
jgi:STE24 endopeptidase